MQWQVKTSKCFSGQEIVRGNNALVKFLIEVCDRRVERGRKENVRKHGFRSIHNHLEVVVGEERNRGKSSFQLRSERTDVWQEAENNSSKGSKARCGEPTSTKVSKIKKLRWGYSNEKMRKQ